MGLNIYYLKLMFILINFYQQQKLMEKEILTEIFFFEEKRQEALEKKLGYKFIRINTSKAKNGHDLDYAVGNIEAFTNEFKNKKIKYLEDKIK